jgi:predicted ArsR family transcriptional regulator
VAASVPERRYDLAGSLLAMAVAESERTGTPVGTCLTAAARAAGRVIGEEASAATGSLAERHDRQQAVLAILGSHGYEPQLDERGEIALVNCPFHRLAQEHRTLVCGMNLDFLAGLIEGVGPGELSARLAPEAGYCCVRIDAS